jgi:ATP-binding cassette, subfamily C, bacterial LapB
MIGLPNWLFDIVRLPLRYFIRLATYSLFINLLALATPIFVLQVYDRVVFQSGIDTLKALLIGVLICLIFDYIIRQSRSRLLQYISLKIDGTLGTELFEKFTSLELSTLEKRPASYWQQIFKDTEHIRNFFGGATVILLIDIPFSIIFISIIYLIAPPLIWVFLGATLIFSLLAWQSSASVKKASLEEQQGRGALDQLLVEVVSHRATIRSLNLGGRLKALWLNRLLNNMGRSIRRGRVVDRYSNLNTILTMGVTISLTCFGALAILEQTMTIGSLIAANMLAARVIQPLSQLSLAWRSLNQFRASRDRLSKLFIESEKTESTLMLFDRPKGAVNLVGISYSYQTENYVLSDVNLSFVPGEIHAVIGNNGGGKSTLLKLIQNLYQPDSGKVLWDGADVRQFERRHISNWLGYVSQDCTLFTGSIRDNIAGFSSEADDKEILEISKKLGLHTEISNLTDGYNTMLGEGGHVLSFGQRQKIATIRALIGNPAVLLLDEPTSNLDQQSELQLGQFLYERAKKNNVTIIVITHSPTLISKVDKITLIKSGKVIMSGKKDDILPKLMRPASES